VTDEGNLQRAVPQPPSDFVDLQTFLKECGDDGQAQSVVVVEHTLTGEVKKTGIDQSFDLICS
jgi:hypothetical protein